jgi:hypothetical protein
MIWRCRQRGKHLKALVLSAQQTAHPPFRRFQTTQATAEGEYVESTTNNVDGIAYTSRLKSSDSKTRNNPSSIEEVREAIYHPHADVHIRSAKILPRRIVKSTQVADFQQLFQWIEDWPESSAVDHVAWAHRIVIQHVTSQEEGNEFEKLIRSFAKLLEQRRYKQNPEANLHFEDNPTPADTLRFYNAVMSRLKGMQVAFGPEALFQGLYFAAEARSTTAMKRYLQAASKIERYLERVSWIPDLLKSIDHWVATDSFTGWEGIRRKQELLDLMIGLKGVGDEGSHGVRQVCIHDVTPAALEPDYLSIIRRLSDADTVFDHWLHFKSTTLQITSPPEPQNLRHSQDRIIEAYVQNLIQADDPKRAWHVMEESGCRPDALGESTWDDLLEHPEYLGKWQDGMGERVLHKYDECLSRIEQSLGVHWSGGEDGFHLPAILQGEPEDGPQSEG